MDEMPVFFKLFLVLFALIVLLMIVMIIKSVIQTRHTKEYVAVRGWTYRSRDRKLAKRWTGPPFESGHDQRCEDIVEGHYQGWPFAAFVYRYDTGSGDDESTWSTVIVALLAESSLPDLDVVREGAFSRAMGKAFNYDIQLESEEFNRAYTVRSDDRKFASSVLHPRMMEQLLRGPRDSWSIRNGDLLDLDNWNGRPEQITDRLDYLIGVLQGIPDFVWQDHGGRPEQLKQGVS